MVCRKGFDLELRFAQALRVFSPGHHCLEAKYMKVVGESWASLPVGLGFLGWLQGLGRNPVQPVFL